jgi:hypothetical protein
MTDDNKRTRDRTRPRPYKHADAVAARMALLKETAKEEDVAFDARTAKLRALRLAKEEPDSRNATTIPKPPEGG